MILFFETYSVIQTLFLFKYIKDARTIYFHKKAFPPIKSNSRSKRHVMTLIRLFNKNAQIKTPPVKKINEYTWSMNKKAVEFVEDLSDEIKNSSVYKIILGIVRDKNILRCYKMQLADDVSTRLLFFRIGYDLIEKYGHENDIFLVPADNDNSTIQRKLFGRETLGPHILSCSLMANAIRNIFYKTCAGIIFLLFPLGYMILNFRRIVFKKVSRKSYDIAVPVIWGFHRKDIVHEGVKGKEDDGYLYGREIEPGQVIHIFNYWRRDPATEAKYKKNMDDMGIPNIDRTTYRIPPGLLLNYAKIQLQIIRQFLLNAFYWHDKCSYIRYSSLILNWVFNKYVEFANVDYKVEVIRHDYSPHHIVETILCNQHNKKTIGVQHGANAGPYVLNGLCFVHMDKYCIFGEAYRRLYSPYWDKLPLERVGYWRIDYLIKLLEDGQQLSSIRDKIDTLYGKRRYIVLISFPSDGEHNMVSRWDEMYKALCDFKSYHLDCHIFLRFRSVRHLAFPPINRLTKLPERDNRFIIDNTNFTTYELMAVCDLYITSSHSTGLIEAVALGKRAFTFDYMMTAKYCFDDYGKDLVLTTKSDVLKLFKDLDNDFEGYDCRWDLLKRDYNYYYDGRCLERFRQAVYRAVQEVSR